MKIELESHELMQLVEQVEARARMQGAPAQGYDPLTAKLVKVSQAFASVARGNKIEAIKVIREAFGVGLKEAKDIVEGAYF